MSSFKSYIILISLLLLTVSSYAYDIALKSPSGQTLYYNILQSDSIPYTVEVTLCPSGKTYSGEIIIPDTIIFEDKKYYVTSIAPHAFAKAEKLTAIELPNTIVSLGSNAFRDCINLQSITLPEYLTYIGGYCMVNCISLKSIGIPQHVSYIGTFAFGNCKSMHNIYVDLDNKYYSSIAGILFDKTGQELIQYPALRDGTKFEIPPFVNFIADWAFCGAKKLKVISIPYSVLSIGRSAFWGCKNLASIDIPNTVDVIKSYTFYDCKNLMLASVSKSTKIVSTAFPQFTKIHYTKARNEEEEEKRPKIKRKEKIDVRPKAMTDLIMAQYNIEEERAAAQAGQVSDITEHLELPELVEIIEPQQPIDSINQIVHREERVDSAMQIADQLTDTIDSTTVQKLEITKAIADSATNKGINRYDSIDIVVALSPTDENSKEIIFEDSVDNEWTNTDEYLEKYISNYYEKDSIKADTIRIEQPQRNKKLKSKSKYTLFGDDI